MKLRIIGSVAIAILFAWPALVLADGEKQPEMSSAGTCGAFVLAGVAAAAGGQSLIRSIVPTPVQPENAEKIAQVTLDKCVTCCNRNQLACDKKNGQHCEFKHTKCVAHCNKEGRMSSDWYCWWQPQMTW